MYSFKLTQGVELAEGVVVEMRLPEPLARFTIGRDPSNPWCIPDRTLAISARHCEIVTTPSGPALRDLSTNGTFVNGAAARLSGSHLLRDGDRIVLGPYQITVSGPKVAVAPVADAAQPAAPAPRPPAVALRGGDPAAMLALGAAAGPRFGVTELLRSAPPPEDSDVDVTRIRVAPPRVREATPAASAAAPAPVVATPPPVAVPPVAVPESLPLAAAAAATWPVPLDPVAPPLAALARASQPLSTGDAAAVLAALAAGLGLAPTTWAGRDAAEVAGQVGTLARAAVAALAQLLAQQAQARRQIGSRSPALVPVRELNPLRVARSPEAALLALLAPGVDAQQPLQRAAAELAAHQDRLLAALAGATQRLGEELAPDSLDAAVAGSDEAARAAQRWALYTGLWQGMGLAPGRPWSEGFAEAARLHLAAAYDEQGKA
ncbi:FHA domain-containing protein [Rubrivivax sp. A210]|uniref:type VI secretion system-associated FHA domain protein TagH n=1 Tax=Rubrivivax sp. A210 TaxID=2772301 RepID=UPI00191B0954|nr:type VI secretion system-associated FHA domain protein TagH [Rubrivivax sp. A210]CAD5369876.1 FHA domain-containing protein [Rubrivivax sp. A210]